MWLTIAPPIIDIRSRLFEGNNLRHNANKPQMTDTKTRNTMLSIMILTRNRKEELLRALRSCIECSLPPKTEFVIVDNASQDGTEEAVDCFFERNLFEYHYYYQTVNMGVAAGRNEGFRRTNGRYVYFIDDDAYIDGPKHIFFEKMIGFLEENKEVFCVTTSIFDIALNSGRFVRRPKDKHENGYDKVLMFHGGSCLVDKQRLLDQNRLYLEQQLWGMEELYPSLKSYFSDSYVAEMKDLNVIHEPSTNTRFERKKYVLLVCVGAAHVKLALYPLVTYPWIYLHFYLRIIKHLGFGALSEASTLLSEVNQNLVREPVPFPKFIQIVGEFGVRAAL